MKNPISAFKSFVILSMLISCNKQDSSFITLTATIGHINWSTADVTAKDNFAAGFIMTFPGPNGEQFWLTGYGQGKLDSVEIACTNDEGTFATSTADHISYTDKHGNVFYSVNGSGSISISRHFVSKPNPDAGTIYNYSGNFNAVLYSAQNDSSITIGGIFYYKSPYNQF